MMQYIKILKVSENMADATVGRWHVSEGEPVAPGDLVVDLITEKADFEIEAEQKGILLRQFAPSKSIVPVGFTVALIGTEDETIPPEIQEENQKLMQGTEITVKKKNSPASRSTETGRKVKATPAARRKAKKAGIDLADVQKGLKTQGVVTEKQVEQFIQNR